jgi:hypothetical protein
VIPSRSLALVEIITETFSIYGRTFVRYGLLFLLLIVPGICLITAGTTSFTEDFVASAKHEINFGDSDLTNARNDFNALITEQNPAISEKLPGAGLPYPHANTRQLYYFFRTNFTRFSSSIDLLASGLLLLTIGVFALIASTVDLASQVFEERRQELFGSLRAAFMSHVWKMLLLYLLYMIAILGLDGILGLLPDAAADALSGFVLVAQIYLVLRLFVTIPALISEESGPFQAIVRSWWLTKNAMGRIFGASFVFSIILFVAFLFVGLIMQFFFSDFSLWWNEFLTRDHLTLQWLLESVPGALWAAAAESAIALLLLFGLMPIFGTVLYYDLRTRHDGPLVYVDENIRK